MNNDRDMQYGKQGSAEPPFFKKGPSFCSNCGTKLIGSERFCAECGQPIYRPDSPAARETPAVSLTSEDLEKIYKKAQEQWDKGEYDDALQTLMDVLPYAPRNASLLNRIGFTYRKKEDFETAIEYYRKALEYEKDPVFVSNIAMAYYNKGDLNEAIANMQEAIKMLEGKPNNNDKGLIYSNYALLIGAAGYLEGARDSLKLAQQYGHPKKECDNVWIMLRDM